MALIGKDFPQTREARKAKLSEIKNEPGSAISTTKIPGKGVKDVYRIPLEFLSYNPHNTRFLAQAKTLEKRFGTELSNENPEHVKEIEAFIWNAKRDKNESTILSLIEDGQLQPGVVTSDGIILSGNRRFRLLNEISRNPDKYKVRGRNLEGLQYFEAAIIDGELSKKEIISYESFYQYGSEDKVDYDPIQKYIAASDQYKLGFTIKEIARNFMSITEGKESEVKKWLQVYDLMEQYLSYIGEDEIYTALESREEAFLNLRSQLKSFQRGKTGNNAWAYEDFDLDDLKRIFFDYIRLNMPTHNVRIFKDIFIDEKQWKGFNKAVREAVKAKPVESFEDYRTQNTDLEESEVSKKRNNDFKENAGEALMHIYAREKFRLDERNNVGMPIDFLKSIQTYLDKLENDLSHHPDKDTYESDEFMDMLRDIQHRVGKIKQTVD